MTIRRCLLLAAYVLTVTPVFGTEIPITEPRYRPADATSAVVASSGDSFVTVWTSSDGRMFSRALDLEGRPVGATNLVDISAEWPRLVWIGDRYRLVRVVNERRYRLGDRAELVDLDRTGRVIEGSRLSLDGMKRPLLATNGGVTFVAGQSSTVEVAFEWCLIEPDGSTRRGSIWVGSSFYLGAIFSRDGDFGVLWGAGGAIYRFELFSGRVQLVTGSVGTWATTALGDELWVATASKTGATVTIMSDPEIRTIRFATRPSKIFGAHTMKGQVVVHAVVDDRHRLYRFADDGSLLQQFDLPPDMTAFSIAAGVDSILAVGSRDGIFSTASFPFGLDGISGPSHEDVVATLAESARTPAIAATADRNLVVWSEAQPDDDARRRLVGLILDPSTGVSGESFVIFEYETTGSASVRAVGENFLVWIRTAQQDFRAVLIDPDGQILANEPFAPEVPFVEDWAWTGSTYLAASRTYQAAYVTTWDGASTVTSREVGHAEPVGEDAWSAIDSARVETGRNTILVTWNSIVSHCFFPACYDPRQAFGRLLDRETLEPLTDAFPIGDRDQYDNVETAWNGTYYGVWIASKGELIRLTESGEIIEEAPIRLREQFGRSFSPVSTVRAVDDKFVVSWLEETWMYWSGVVVRIVYPDGALSPLRAFPIFTESPGFVAASSGSQLFLSYSTRVPDEELLGASRAFVRTLDDTPMTSPPLAPRLTSVFQTGNTVSLEWEDRSDDEIFFEIIPTNDHYAAHCDWLVRPPDTSSATMTCVGSAPFTYQIVGWNAAGYGDRSEGLQAMPPQRRHPARR